MINPFHKSKVVIVFLSSLLQIQNLFGQAREEQPSYNIDSLKKIESIDFRLMEINQLPEWLFYCKNLKKIFFGSNPNLSMKKVINSLAQFDSLTFISIRNNHLVEFPSDLCKIKNLKEIDLAYNDLSIVPNDITGFNNLESINLDNNKLSEHEVNLLIDKMPELKTLSIRNNELNHFPLLACNSSIMVIYMSGNKISVLPECVYDMPWLMYMVFSNGNYGDDRYENKINLDEVKEEIKKRQKRIGVD